MNKLSSISNNKIFQSYLLSGRKWPQKRWASIIVLLSDIGKLNENLSITNLELQKLLSHKLSQDELTLLKKIMISDHTNAGINIKFINDDILEYDFIKTQIGIKNVVEAFLNDRLPEYFNSKDLKEIHSEYQKLPYFNCPIQKSQGDVLYDIANICEQQIKIHNGLAKLFRITYYNIEQRLALIYTPEYTELLKLYNINFEFKSTNLINIRQQISHIMFDYMKTAVNKEYPKIQPFFIYDKHYKELSKNLSTTFLTID